jgi:HD-GYP domain-containing protein (c-di-GMP phosphodiesterase class II)
VSRHHHGRWNGNGYPDGLTGAAIPVEAKIAGLADAWDATTTDRPYRRALSDEDAFGEVRRGRATGVRAGRRGWLRYFGCGSSL